MYILASTSPRRIELFKNITIDFKIIKPNFDEKSIKAPANKLPALLSIGKANSVQACDNDIIVAADTIVSLDGEILGKPNDFEDGKNMLRKLSGKAHQVITGYTIKSATKIVTKTVVSKVFFNDLSDELITKYILEMKPLDKAGGYGIQDDESYHLINKIEGSKNNIIGFPLEEIKLTLKEF